MSSTRRYSRLRGIALAAAVIIASTTAHVAELPPSKAAAARDIEGLEGPLRSGTDPNVRGDHGKTPLHGATDGKAASALLRAGADPNARDDFGKTPLHSISTNGRGEAASALLRAGADPNAQDDRGKTPLHAVIEWGSYGSYGGESSRGDLETVERLLEAGADPNVRDSTGQVPLHWVYGPWSSDAVSALLRAGADPNARDRFGQAPLHRVHGPWSSDAVSALLRAGADPNARNFRGETPLHRTRGGEVARALLRAGADPNARDHAGWTPLHRAGDGEALVSALVHAGADPDARDFDGKTPLHVVTELNQRLFDPSSADLHLGVDSAAILLEAGADPNVRAIDGSTPLHFVARHSSSSALAAVLLDGGASLSMVDRSFQTPLSSSTLYNDDHSVANGILKYHFSALDDVREVDSDGRVVSTTTLLGPGLHQARCWFDQDLAWPMKDCFFMVVNEDPHDASSSLIGFPVVKFFVRPDLQEQVKNPVLHLGGGGPGSPLGIQFPNDIWSQYGSLVLGAGRDFYVIDPRGVGMAQPRLHCLEGLDSVRRAIGEDIDREEENTVWLSGYRACKQRLDEEGRDLSNYNSRVVARDVELLRRAFGVSRWVLYGVSYGSRYALTIARDYPDSVEAMILNGAAFPNLPGVDRPAKALRSALNKAFSYCESAGTCVAESLEQRFWDLMESLNQTPLVVDGLNEVPEYVLTGSRLLDLTLWSLYDADFFQKMPDFVTDMELRKTGMPRELIDNYLSGYYLDPTYSDPIFESHFCAEVHPFVDYVSVREDARAYNEHILNLVVSGGDYSSRLCELWSVATAEAIESRPVVTSIPTLFLQGALDPATPIEYLDGQRQHFDEHAVLVFQNSSHGGSVHSACSMNVASYFIEHKQLGQMPRSCDGIPVQIK